MHPSLTTDLVLLEHRQRIANARLEREHRTRQSRDEHGAHPPERTRLALRLALPISAPLMICAGLR